MVQEGNIVLVPKGTPVTHSEDRADPDGKRPLKRLRKDQVTVVDYVWEGTDVDHDGTTACYMVGPNLRIVPADAVRVLDERNHKLDVGPRRIRGGGWGGWTASYMTSGHCRCGASFLKRDNAREVRTDWRAHVQLLAEQALEQAA